MLPSRKDAEYELTVAGEFHPGTWISQSYNIASAAYEIAKQCDGLDAEKAYILGLLHNIGYRHCIENGWDEVAKICITHRFPLKEKELLEPCSKEEAGMKQYLENCTYDVYDKLIILCKALVGSHSIKTLEQRFIEGTIGGQVNQVFVARWNRLFEIKEQFEQQIHSSIYDLLEEAIADLSFTSAQ